MPGDLVSLWGGSGMGMGIIVGGNKNERVVMTALGGLALFYDFELAIELFASYF